MAKRKFIEVILGNYSIIHGYNANNEEIREVKQVTNPKKTLIATDTILAVDEQFIITSQIKNKLFIWEYDNNYEDIRKELCKQTVSAY